MYLYFLSYFPLLIIESQILAHTIYLSSVYISPSEYKQFLFVGCCLFIQPYILQFINNYFKLGYNIEEVIICFIFGIVEAVLFTLIIIMSDTLVKFKAYTIIKRNPNIIDLNLDTYSPGIQILKNCKDKDKLEFFFKNFIKLMIIVNNVDFSLYAQLVDQVKFTIKSIFNVNSTNMYNDSVVHLVIQKFLRPQYKNGNNCKSLNYIHYLIVDKFANIDCENYLRQTPRTLLQKYGPYWLYKKNYEDNVIEAMLIKNAYYQGLSLSLILNPYILPTDLNKIVFQYVVDYPNKNETDAFVKGANIK